MKAQLRLAGGRRKLGRNGSRSDIPREGVDPPEYLRDRRPPSPRLRSRTRGRHHLHRQREHQPHAHEPARAAFSQLPATPDAWPRRRQQNSTRVAPHGVSSAPQSSPAVPTFRLRPVTTSPQRFGTRTMHIRNQLAIRSPLLFCCRFTFSAPWPYGNHPHFTLPPPFTPDLRRRPWYNILSSVSLRLRERADACWPVPVLQRAQGVPACLVWASSGTETRSSV